MLKLKNITTYRKGFSLVEIILTLIALGVVGNFAFSALMNYSKETKNTIASKQTIQNQSYETAWQMELNSLNQATNVLLQNNGGSFTNVCSNSSNQNKCLKDLYSQYITTIKSCDTASTECWHKNGSWEDQTNKIISAGIDSASGMISTNGYLFLFNNINTKCPGSTCGQIYVDMNGFEKPNKIGADIFAVNIHESSLAQF